MTQPTPGTPSLVDDYATATQNCRDIASQVGPTYDEHPQWRAAERRAEHLWKQARAAGHTTAELIAAGKPQDGDR